MHSTRVALGRGTVSTSHGQNRILKHSTPDLLTYIQKAVQTGVYRSNAEIEEMNKSLEENPTDLKRLRWNVLRGSKIHDYPEEYEILSLNPPEPFRPHTPVKERRKAVNKYIKEHRPMDGLAQSYLNRQRSSSGEPATAEEYYRRLLGVNKANRMDSAMGHKSALLNKAYAVAVKQYHMMRTEDLSEKEALEKVEELLKEEDFNEKTSSRTKAKDLAQKTKLENLVPEERAKAVFPSAIFPEADISSVDDDSAIAMLYSENQRAFEGMISWTKKLQAVPYRQWTVGASTALDHWIAKRVLGLSEETWLELLEGDSPELMGRGRDIVMARHALFPETLLEDEKSLQEEDPEDDSVGDDLDALLATLGGWKTDENKKFDWKAGEGLSGDDNEDKVVELTVQLQDWRKKNISTPYNNWTDEEKQTFTVWLQDYVATLTPESQLHKVDMTETRNALLAVPPLSKEDSDQFWDEIQDETTAEVFLQQLLADKTGDETHPFYDLEYSQQLEQLVNLGSIREIADEYAKESDRSKFLARYGDYLFEGLEMEHLVVDPTGPIRGADLGEALRKHYDIKESDRFRLITIPYGQDDSGTEASQRARDLYRSWNKLKAGRAHYEEKLFQRGILGLTYEKEEKK